MCPSSACDNFITVAPSRPRNLSHPRAPRHCTIGRFLFRIESAHRPSVPDSIRFDSFWICRPPAHTQPVRFIVDISRGVCPHSTSRVNRRSRVCALPLATDPDQNLATHDPLTAFFLYLTFKAIGSTSHPRSLTSPLAPQG